MKREYQFIAIALLFLTTSCRQPKTKIDDIDNVKTDKHINIPGTRLFIVPPADFKIATSFVGLQKDNNDFLRIQDYAGNNYYTYAESFNKEDFETGDAKILEYKEFKVNDFPAKYVHLQNNSGSSSIGLFFGDSSFFIMIAAVYLSSDHATGEEIQNSIKTIFYDKNFKVDNSLASAPFTLDESKSVFKFSNVERGMFMYYVGGENIEKNKDEPYMMVSIFSNFGQPMPPKKISEELITGMEENGFTVEELDNISTANVNGLPAYEVEIYGKNQRKNILIYQLIVMGTDNVIAIQGIAKSDFDSNLKEFKNLARTIKLK